jgi:hypothetical protein
MPPPASTTAAFSLQPQPQCGRSLLHLAVLLGTLGLIKELLTMGASIDAKDNEVPPLSSAE